MKRCHPGQPLYRHERSSYVILNVVKDPVTFLAIQTAY